jgi:hypothetical protein
LHPALLASYDFIDIITFNKTGQGNTIEKVEDFLAQFCPKLVG